MCPRTKYALIWGRKVKLTCCLHQIATFLLPFPKTPILATIYAIIAIWLYGHLAIMAPYSHIAIWPFQHQIWPVWVFSETAMKKWQSGEDGKSIWPSYLKYEQIWSEVTISFVFLQNSFVNTKSGGQARILSFDLWFFGNYLFHIYTQHILPLQKSSSMSVHFRTP